MRRISAPFKVAIDFGVPCVRGGFLTSGQDIQEPVVPY